MNEYVLIGALVITVVVVSLTNLGQVLNGLLTNMIVDNSNANSGSGTVIASANPGGGGLNLPGEETGNPGGVGDNKINGKPNNGNPNGVAFNPTNQNLTDLGVKSFQWTDAQGKKHTFQVQDVNGILETTGPNGVTNAYLTQLDAVIAAMKESLPADDPVLADFVGLSLKGHALFSKQQVLEANYHKLVDPRFGTQLYYQAMTEQNFQCPGCSTNFSNLDLTTMGTTLQAMLSDPLSNRGAGAAGGSTATTTNPSALLMEFMIKAGDINQNQLKGPQYEGLRSLMNYFAGNIYQAATLTETDLLQIRSSGQQLTQGGGPSFQFEKRGRFIEANANDICGMSNTTNQCFKNNGEPVATHPAGDEPRS